MPKACQRGNAEAGGKKKGMVEFPLRLLDLPFLVSKGPPRPDQMRYPREYRLVTISAIALGSVRKIYG